MSPRIRSLILAFAVLGLGFSAASTWVHYRLLTDPSYVSVCDVSSTFNCSQAYLSRYGSVAGVPVAIGGMIWFGLVGLLAAFAQPNEKNSVAATYLFVLATIGLGVIGYLAYASFAVLQSWCLLCIGTYVSVVGIFILSTVTNGESVSRLPSRLARDLRGVAARPAALAAALVYLTAALSAVAMFPRDGAASAQAAAAAPSADAQQSFATAWEQQPRVNLGIPADGARVIIVKFNDFQCGACAQAENFYKPIVEKFEKSHPGAVRYVVKDWPWDTKCNFNASRTIRGHEAACDSAAAARMARDRGKYDEMASWLYANQGAPPSAVRAAAARILGVTDFDREYAQKLPEIRQDIADGGVLGVNGTPTYFINGVRLPGGFPPQYFELAINLELQKSAT